MELTLILIPIFVFVLLRMWLDHRAQARADNVRLLEEALKNPHLDRPTIESIAFQLTGARARPGPSAFLATVLALGWLALFVGLALWVAGSLAHERELVLGGTLTAIIGFGVVTYPFALRELEARRQAP